MAEPSVLDRYKIPAESKAAPRDPDAAIDDYLAFGWLRGVKECCISLELRKKTGSVIAIGYAWLQKVEFNPSDGITLWFAGEKFRIQGQNLNAEVRQDVRLFDGLIRHKVPWIQESPDSDRFGRDAHAVVVDSITP